MPNDTIDRAIKRGTGELEGVNYEEITYEGYGIGGVAVLVETMTDNRNRTVAELRHLFSKNGGNLGEAGSVAWMFDKKIYTAPENFDAVLDAVKAAGIEPQAAEISQVPQNFIKLEGADAQKMLKLYDAIDDNDDVQKVHANFDIDESEMG
jgi:transcriptional/translational regulatory protein YebC/TACO1